ncbi:hypothetical protein HO133_001388 [Letharia lupina]|uniref:Uncharacterized protein n=1 Tax=Letharia lupina TaxID=560253 RepID=A0A8H6CF16_9LECA|nr:uncharacterized protein HO133_001388 [Letharia lupina]KAF6222302.1 hypothetical protein HO133_001388 [Letharia lupina]
MFSSHVFHPGSQNKMQQQAVAEEARVQEISLPESPVPCTVYLRWGRWAAEFDCRYDIEKDAVHRGLFAFKSTNHPIHREIHLLYPSNAPVLEEDTSLDDNGRPFLRLTLRQGTSDGKPRLPEELMTVEVYAKRIPAGQRREMSERELDGFGWEIEEGTSDPWELDL